MKFFLLIIIILLFTHCSKPKTVLICGDHVCINKAEAEQYFEDNLSLEVKVVDPKKPKEVNLVEINLETSSENNRKISVSNKQQTDKVIKELSNSEIKKKKAELKKRVKTKEKNDRDNETKKLVKLKKKRKLEKIQNNNIKVGVGNYKPREKITNICSILPKCNIEEISKYLVKQGKEKKFPNIATRENK